MRTKRPFVDQLRFTLDILELEPGATFDDVRMAYRRLIKRWHPDRHTLDPAYQRVAEERAKRINDAYAWISDHRWALDLEWKATCDDPSIDEGASFTTADPMKEPAPTVAPTVAPKESGNGCLPGIIMILTFQAARAIGDNLSVTDRQILEVLVPLLVVTAVVLGLVWMLRRKR